ncbi:hypothetical protein J4212_00700 [Candidatus Woesearchaeota archaeon]|nr:hypothetical protein [Candidatus Woesearchaeota archaeon]
MNKKAFIFGMMHPGLMFIIGIALGAAIVYFGITKGFIPVNLPAVK